VLLVKEFRLADGEKTNFDAAMAQCGRHGLSRLGKRTSNDLLNTTHTNVVRRFAVSECGRRVVFVNTAFTRVKPFCRNRPRVPPPPPTVWNSSPNARRQRPNALRVYLLSHVMRTRVRAPTVRVHN